MTLIGTTLGRIRILDTLGRGGMGEVFVGYDETLKRKVALKAISDARRLDGEAKARFLQEARILSQLDHPGICRIHEFIEGEEGDFLVLEFIDGITLREALKDDLDPAFKLLVAEKVAEALVAAHSKGIAHRDLKPENVMLTAEGDVKVLDFGLAFTVDAQITTEAGSADLQAADPQTADPPAAELMPRPLETVLPAGGTDAIETEAGTIMGTLAYMSPEQARGERPGTAGDLYSFGLILQEMITGRSAYEPGLKVPMLVFKAAAAETLDAKQVDPKLDADLAALLERLKSPVAASRPSAVETLDRLRFIRAKPRRRLRRFAIAAAVVLLISGGLKYTFDLRHERALAVEARRESEQVSEFLVDLFAVSEPQKARGNAITARELLDAGAGKIREELRGQPRSQGRLMLTMGRVYRQIGLYAEARPLLEEALEIHRRELGEEHLDTVACLDQLASLHHDQGQYGLAEPFFLRALEIREKLLGGEHPHVAASLGNLAFLYRARGDAERAAPLFERALEIQRRALGDEHPDVAKSLNNLGELYRERGDPARAAPLLRRAIEIQEKRLGEDHPSLVFSLNNLAMIHHEQGEAEKAEPLYLRTLAISERVLGEEHPNVASILNNLAELHRQGGQYERAEPLYLRALAIQEKTLGPSHPGVAVSLSNLADLYSAIADAERAEPLYRRALEIEEQTFPADHPSVVITLVDLADLYVREGRYEEAGELYRRALDGAEREWTAQPESHGARRRLAAVRIGLGRLLKTMGTNAEAARELAAGVGLMEGIGGGAEILGDLHLHAVALLELGRIEEARGMVERLTAKGWRHPELLRLGREAGLVEDRDPDRE